MLVDIAAGSASPETQGVPNSLTALGTTCLVALAVARGEADMMINTIASLIMTPKRLAEQDIKVNQ